MVNPNDPGWLELYPDLELSERIGPDQSEWFTHYGKRRSTHTTIEDVEIWLKNNAPTGVLTPAAEARMYPKGK